MTDRDELATQGIGASEVAGAVGESPWLTPAGLWLRKVDLAAPQPDTDPMRIGRELEPILVRLLADRLGARLRHNAQTFTHPDWPQVPLYATPDAFGAHRWTAAEIKVVAHHLDDWRAGPPAYVRLQVLAQMAVLPRVQRVWVGALVGSELRTWPVERDDPAIALLEAGVARWWQTYVVPEVSPGAQGPEDAWALLRARVSQQAGRPDRVASDEEEVLAARLAALLDQRLDLTAQVDEVRLALADAARDENLAAAGWRATWTERRTVDWAEIAKRAGASPRLIDAHTRHSPVFTFRRLADATREEAAL